MESSCQSLTASALLPWPQVNLKKQTLALEPTGTPGMLGINFAFDASAPCRVSTFVVAHEDVRRSCKITAQSPPAPALLFPKGVSHRERDQAMAALSTDKLRS